MKKEVTIHSGRECRCADDGGHMGGFSDQAETSGFSKGAVTFSDQFQRLGSADGNFSQFYFLVEFFSTLTFQPQNQTFFYP